MSGEARANNRFLHLVSLYVAMALIVLIHPSLTITIVQVLFVYLLLTWSVLGFEREVNRAVVQKIGVWRFALIWHFYYVLLLIAGAADN